MSSPTRIAVTGLGAVSPFGEGIGALWAGLISGASGISRIERFDTSGFRSHLAGLVRTFEPRRVIPPGVLRRLDRASSFAVAAAAQALDQAAPPDRDRAGVILGTNCAGSVPVAEFLKTIAADGPAAAPPILFPYTVANAPASQCALILGLRGPNLTVVQKEASSCGAIAVACRMIASGAASGLLACGADDLSAPVFEVLDRLGVLSRDRSSEGGAPEGSRPFDRLRNGLVCGEGAYALYLESEATARARGAAALAFIEGTGTGRSPAPPHRVPSDAAPLARTVKRALSEAGVQPDSIDAVFACANSTPDLDAREAEALRSALGSAVPPVCSVRGALGDSGAGGAASAIAACLAMREGRLPGTAGLEWPDASLGLDLRADTRDLQVRRTLVTAFASGGSAVAIVVANPLL